MVNRLGQHYIIPGRVQSNAKTITVQSVCGLGFNITVFGANEITVIDFLTTENQNRMDYINEISTKYSSSGRICISRPGGDTV